MRRFLVVIGKAGKNYSAYSTDLPRCVAAGRTHKEAECNMEGAIKLHVQGLREDGLPVPKPEASAEYVTIES